MADTVFTREASISFIKRFNNAVVFGSDSNRTGNANNPSFFCSIPNNVSTFINVQFKEGYTGNLSFAVATGEKTQVTVLACSCEELLEDGELVFSDKITLGRTYIGFRIPGGKNFSIRMQGWSSDRNVFKAEKVSNSSSQYSFIKVSEGFFLGRPVITELNTANAFREWDPTYTYNPGDPTFYETNLYFANPLYPPSVGDNPVTAPWSWVMLASVVPDPEDFRLGIKTPQVFYDKSLVITTDSAETLKKKRATVGVPFPKHSFLAMVFSFLNLEDKNNIVDDFETYTLRFSNPSECFLITKDTAALGPNNPENLELSPALEYQPLKRDRNSILMNEGAVSVSIHHDTFTQFEYSKPPTENFHSLTEKEHAVEVQQLRTVQNHFINKLPDDYKEYFGEPVNSYFYKNGYTTSDAIRAMTMTSFGGWFKPSRTGAGNASPDITLHVSTPEHGGRVGATEVNSYAEPVVFTEEFMVNPREFEEQKTYSAGLMVHYSSYHMGSMFNDVRVFEGLKFVPRQWNFIAVSVKGNSLSVQMNGYDVVTKKMSHVLTEPSISELRVNNAAPCMIGELFCFRSHDYPRFFNEIKNDKVHRGIPFAEHNYLDNWLVLQAEDANKVDTNLFETPQFIEAVKKLMLPLFTNAHILQNKFIDFGKGGILDYSNYGYHWQQGTTINGVKAFYLQKD